MFDLDSIAPDPAWTLRVSGFDPHSERETESCLVVSNGLVGVRGSLEEGTPESQPATLFAGIFNRLPTSSTSSDGESPALIVGPNWLKLSIWIDGEPLSINSGETVEHERILDMRRAIMIRRWRQRLNSERVVRFETLRAALLPHKHLLAQRAWLTLEGFEASVRLVAQLDGEIATGLHFEDPTSAVEGVLAAHTQAAEFRVAMAQAGHLECDVVTSVKRAQSRTAITDCWEWRAERDRVYSFNRVVTWYTSRQSGDPAQCAAERARGLPKDTASLFEEHCRAWADRWQASNLEIEGDQRIERAVHFAAYHLMSSVQPGDERISIGARGLSGTGYRGHVFWDTEIYMLAFFIFTWPAAARSLLMYRYHTLDLAREKAAALGYRGALFPWESVAGYETTPEQGRAANGETVQIRTGRFAHHIAADVAYAVYQYRNATGDDRFFADAGVEIALETARFWASRAAIEEDGEYHMRGVVPPDEYHEMVDDSAFNNTMARFNLEFGYSAAQWLEQRDAERWRALASRLSVAPEEVERWSQLAPKLANTSCRGLIEEFAGYFNLEDLQPRAFEPRTAALPVLLGHDKTARTRLNRMEQARNHLYRAASIDLDDSMRNSAQGIHSGAAGGLWQAVIMGFGGLQLVNDTISFDPHLLPEWKSLAFVVFFRNSRLEVTLRQAPATCEFVLTDGDDAWIQLGESERKHLTRRERKLVI